MERAHTHYDNLKVTRNAPTEVIRAAYRVLAQKYHPDVNPSPDALRVMKIFNEAWDVLSDPTRRAEHDQWIVEQERRTKPPKSFTNEYSFTADKEKYTYKHEKAASNWQQPTQSAHSQNDTADAPHNGNSASYSGTAPFENSKAPSLSSLARINAYLGSPYGVVYIGFAVVAIFVLALVSITKPTEIKKDSASTDISKPESSSLEQYSQVPPLSSSQAASLPEKSPKIISFNGKLDTPNQSAKPFVFDPTTAVLVPDASPVIRPSNGYLKGERQKFADGLSSFTIDNSNGSHDAEVRLYLNGGQVRSLFVRVGSTFTAVKLAPDTYRMRYKMIINGEPHVFEAKENFVLSETETETGTRFSRVRVTLYKVKDGNMQTEEIPLDRF